MKSEFAQLALISVIVIIGLVHGTSAAWSIPPQMKHEDRPYTKTAADPLTTGPSLVSDHDKVLVAKFREMHRYCDGQCFYAPDTCSTVSDFANCKVAASIAMHNEDINGDLYCDIFGPDNLRKSFCSSSPFQKQYRQDIKANPHGKHDRFFTITLHRVLDQSKLTCSEKWNEETGRRCRRSEFLGISFLNDQAPNVNDLDEEDLWYICTVDESHLTRISMWTKLSSATTAGAQQILGTKPHLESGAGVVFSKILLDPDTVSMGCQFVIQESQMSLLDPPKNAAFFNELTATSTVTIKLATGIVERDVDDDSIQHPFYDAMGLYPWDVYRGSRISPTDNIFFNQLKVDIVDPITNPTNEEAEENRHRDKFKEIIEKCDKPQNYPGIYIACYPPNGQQNCVHTGRCPVMFIVEVPRSDRSFDKIKAYIYSLVPDYKSLRKVKKPTGFAAVGFSMDDKMGRDVVITCHADGRSDMGVYVSINFEKTNIYPGKVDYSNLVSNVNTWGTVYDASKIMCEFEMNTKFIVNMFEYEPTYRTIIYPGLSEKLEFDFKREPVHLLVSAGNRNYPDGVIVHHDFRQVLKNKFSMDQFFLDAKGTRFPPPLLSVMLIGILIVL